MAAFKSSFSSLLLSTAMRRVCWLVVIAVLTAMAMAPEDRPGFSLRAFLLGLALGGAGSLLVLSHAETRRLARNLPSRPPL